ncbi:cysteine three histidine 1 [Gadus macrocephalus]|uniref:cysteine three histidine 1 n=1 Tax=Gadus macrocephalus TaxID=80720 RepID=UPI0028CB71CC|nr:cysteine three histidine 1 [Gadus macrocephalus]
MFETSSDDLFLPPYHEEMVDNLLSNESSDDYDCGSSLADALLPLVESSASPITPWLCSTRYKTELCTSYAASGLCNYAERCQFAHGLQELHVPYRHPKYKTELCRSFHTTGYCYYGTRCLFVHGATEQRPACRPRRKNVPCRTFRSYGVCPFGTRCNFLHVDELGDGVDGVAEESPVSCGRGSSCGSSVSGIEEKSPADFLTPTFQAQTKEWKPRGALCRTFSSFGFCLYGTRCRFQHGLPSKLKGSDSTLSPAGFQAAIGSRAFSQSYTDMLLSPFSPFSSSPASSNSSPPPSSTCTPSVTTPPVETAAHNAFTFSSQHLNELLLPLALHLQQLESSQALATSAQKIWDNRAL